MLRDLVSGSLPVIGSFWCHSQLRAAEPIRALCIFWTGFFCGSLGAGIEYLLISTRCRRWLVQLLFSTWQGQHWAHQPPPARAGGVDLGRGPRAGGVLVCSGMSTRAGFTRRSRCQRTTKHPRDTAFVLHPRMSQATLLGEAGIKAILRPRDGARTQ
eukprot:s7123_g4.t1